MITLERRMTADERHILRDVDQTAVGRKIFDATGRPPIAQMQQAQRFVAETLGRDPTYFASLARNMHNNSPMPDWHEPAGENQSSAYFTYNPDLRRVYVEWGLVKDNNAKLHDYLNQVLSPELRAVAGCVVRSGHYATTRTSKEYPTSFSVAMLDSLRDPVIKPNQSEFPLVRAMSRIPFIILTTDGQVCKLG